MLRKCKNCLSCLVGTWYLNKLYYYCTLCGKAYGLVGPELTECTEVEITEHLKQVYGNQV